MAEVHVLAMMGAAQKFLCIVLYKGLKPINPVIIYLVFLYKLCNSRLNKPTNTDLLLFEYLTKFTIFNIYILHVHDRAGMGPGFGVRELKFRDWSTDCLGPLGQQIQRDKALPHPHPHPRPEAYAI